MTIKTFPVSAGAYKNHDYRAFRTHACEVDAAGFPVSVLCTRVKLESILEDSAVATDVAPTCPMCAKRAVKR